MGRARRVAPLLVSLPLFVAACGGSGSPTRAAAGSSGGAASSSACARLLAILSDGPDPGADPVGYAESQILPLTQLHIANPALSSSVQRLLRADQALFKSDGSDAAAKTQITAADRALNDVCPGVAP
jgi:hypothetical protein